MSFSPMVSSRRPRHSRTGAISRGCIAPNGTPMSANARSPSASSANCSGSCAAASSATRDPSAGELAKSSARPNAFAARIFSCTSVRPS